MLVLDDASFLARLEEATVPVLVDFWAPWCVPCRRVSPLVRELGQRHAGRLAVATLDVDANPRSAGRHDVLSLPTLILFRAAQPVARLSGAATLKRLERLVTPHLPAPASDAAPERR